MPRSLVRTCAAILCTFLTILASGAESQSLDLDREHKIVPRSGHAHGKGQVKAVDTQDATVRIASLAIESPDKSISRPPAEVLFHVTNREMLKGLRRGDTVVFEVARIRNAVMITSIRMVP